MRRRVLIGCGTAVVGVVAIVIAFVVFAPRERALVGEYAVSDDGLTLHLLVGYGSGDSIGPVRVVYEDDARVDVEVWKRGSVEFWVSRDGMLRWMWVEVGLAEPLGDRAVYSFGKEIPEGTFAPAPGTLD